MTLPLVAIALLSAGVIPPPLDRAAQRPEDAATAVKTEPSQPLMLYAKVNEKGALEVTYTVYVPVVETRVRKVVENGVAEEVTYTVTRMVPEQRVTLIEKFEVTDLDDKPVEPEVFAKALKMSSPILLLTGDMQIAKSHRIFYNPKLFIVRTPK